jgi:hypothetical protein
MSEQLPADEMTTKEDILQKALRLKPLPPGHEFTGKDTMDNAGCIHCGYNPWRHEYVKCTGPAK